tara:strand:+ start:44 stop:382 length:339 start_codon:yes stop_codon:yes gene_type:complete
MAKSKTKKSRVVCVDNKVFKLLKNNGQIIAEGIQNNAEVEKLSRKLDEAKTKAQNMEAFKKAKHRLNTALSKYDLAMKSWGKAYTYNVIADLLGGKNKASMNKLECFIKNEK